MFERGKNRCLYSEEKVKYKLDYYDLTPEEVGKILSLKYVNDEVLDGDDYHGPFIPKLHSDIDIDEYGAILDAPGTWRLTFTRKDGFYGKSGEEELGWLMQKIKEDTGIGI